jgi:hypothetical protein
LSALKRIELIVYLIHCAVVAVDLRGNCWVYFLPDELYAMSFLGYA